MKKSLRNTVQAFRRPYCRQFAKIQSLLRSKRNLDLQKYFANKTTKSIKCVETKFSKNSSLEGLGKSRRPPPLHAGCSSVFEFGVSDCVICLLVYPKFIDVFENSKNRQHSKFMVLGRAAVMQNSTLVMRNNVLAAEASAALELTALQEPERIEGFPCSSRWASFLVVHVAGSCYGSGQGVMHWQLVRFADDRSTTNAASCRRWQMRAT